MQSPEAIGASQVNVQPDELIYFGSNEIQKEKDN